MASLYLIGGKSLNVNILMRRGFETSSIICFQPQTVIKRNKLILAQHVRNIEDSCDLSLIEFLNIKKFRYHEVRFDTINANLTDLINSHFCNILRCDQAPTKHFAPSR